MSQKVADLVERLLEQEPRPMNRAGRGFTIYHADKALDVIVDVKISTRDV